MINYYLTEMNTLQLENTLLKFMLHHQVTQPLKNGIIGKVATMMYNKHIDYYYADTLATILEVPIKHIDNIYLNGYNKCYNQPLQQLLEQVEAPPEMVENAQQLEQVVTQILKSRKPIKTRKIHSHVQK